MVIVEKSCRNLCSTCREILVHWVSMPSNNPIVKWGLATSKPTHASPAESTTYSSADLCGGPATKVIVETQAAESLLNEDGS